MAMSPQNDVANGTKAALWGLRLSGIAFLIFLAIHGIVSSAQSNIFGAAKQRLVHHQFPSSIDVQSPTTINLPYEEDEDDLRLGKSCVYKKTNHKRKKHSDVDQWVCRECSSDDESYHCKPLTRRGRCHPFQRKNPDETPRVQTEYSPLTRHKSAMAVYHHYGHSEYAKFGIPICSATLSQPCFDLARCRKSTSLDGPLKVYSHGGNVDALLAYATEQHPDLVQRVSNASEACLLVVGPKSFDNPHDLLHDEHWNQGTNHFIFKAGHLFGVHHDRPFNSLLQPGKAAVSHNGMDDSYNREGFDMPLGLYPRWKRPAEYDQLDMHRKRRFLLTFKGNIFPWEQRNWQHRWLASEYWYGEDDVHVDTSCKNVSHVQEGYANTDPDDYGQLLLNSTFFFCPGGGSVNSYRFPEALLGGAIPVVTSDFLPPFHPEIDWSNCIVQVSEARVVDVPRIVREIPAEEVRIRQRRCADLLDAVFGSPPDVKQHFLIAMRVWNNRINHAMKRQIEIESWIPSTH